MRVELVSRDQLSSGANVHYDMGVDQHYVDSYPIYAKFDPMASLPLFDVGQIVSTADVVAHDEFLDSRFYREWVQPQGLIDAADVLLEKTPTGFAYLCIMRGEHQGMVDEEMRHRMALITPHVRRSVLIGKAVELKRVEAAALADVLDGLSAGMILVDANGQIVHLNTAAQIILGTGGFLRASGGRLLAADMQADQALRDAFTASENGDAALGFRGTAVPLVADDSERFVAHVLPLTSGARRRAGLAYAAVAAVFIRKVALAHPSPPEVMGKAFNLTPTELRVMLALVEVGGIPEVAEALGVAETTIKTHVSRLFGKTGVRRQADLVKLVAGYANPLAG